MNLIVAVDENFGIGFQGDLLVKIKEDLQYFKKITLNQIVVMGRVTFDSLPGRKPLKKRINVVLTNNQDFYAEDCMIFHTVDSVLAFLKNKSEEVYIIGGEKIYELFIPYCKKAYITKIYDKFPADKHLNNFLSNPEWQLHEESEFFFTENGIKYQFLVYEKVV